uniref:Family with sequence similarity 217 member B n=2 Tax=Equus asinus TaxID=9793 RepID=A0A9L0ICJ2_EQUAS|nr:protein FAM217B [Equus asinus]XP_014704678.1 protein FAM217B [Equus asinus]XP_044603840.1 protein FAM217B [Equus asinus]XP_044603841.1 protein FAM217B [Equus asinus]XP_044603842.1 protein FAM217B [Equus asinus]
MMVSHVIFFKKGNRVNESHQKSSNMNAGPSWNKIQHSKNSSGKRRSKSQVPHVPSQLKGSLVGVSEPAEDQLKESISPKGKPERSPLSSRAQRASGNRLFLDFQSMKIIKEDADEDSASDLSDSERIPIPPSPLTPPDLNLRAEEIDPVYFDLHPGQGQAKPEYYYPDFLPPPFNSWDLRDMAVLLNTECRTGAVPRIGGLLGKYVDRLIQLEWLQIQTIQSEKAKGAKARPPTALGMSGVLKSPGRSKLIASALSKPHQEGAPQSGPSRRKDLRCEEVHPSYYTFETPPKPPEVLSSSRLCSQKQTFDMRTEEKKKKSHKSTKLQHWDWSCSDSSPKIDSSGNMRIPKQSVMILDSVDSYKASRTQAHANLKKKGKANNCGHATVSSEKKLKTNGVKQNTHKFK